MLIETDPFASPIHIRFQRFPFFFGQSLLWSDFDQPFSKERYLTPFFKMFVLAHLKVTKLSIAYASSASVTKIKTTHQTQSNTSTRTLSIHPHPHKVDTLGYCQSLGSRFRSRSCNSDWRWNQSKICQQGDQQPVFESIATGLIEAQHTILTYVEDIGLTIWLGLTRSGTLPCSIQHPSRFWR